MTIKFKKTKETRVIASNAEGKTVATFDLVEEGWKFRAKDGVELADGVADTICQSFEEWLSRQSPPEEKPPLPAASLPQVAPLPHPVSGTTSPEYISYAADHFTDAAFTDLYETRWSDPKFREFAEAMAPNFCTRCKKLFI
jgi:hypothetical protein